MAAACPAAQITLVPTASAMQTDTIVEAFADDALADAPKTIVGARPVTPSELRAISLFASLAEDELAWLAQQAELVELDPGGTLFHPGEPADWMIIGLEGTLEARRARLGPDAPAFVLQAGDVGGLIPFSRMKEFASAGRARTRARVARIHRTRFPEILRRIPALEPAFVWLLVDRVRDTTRRDDQFEKLVALGRLSAGIAHELNNPTAAILNAFAEGKRCLNDRGRLTADLVRSGVTAETVARLDALLAGDAHRDGRAADGADAVSRSDRIDALTGWLHDQGVPDAWSMAPTLADAALDEQALETALHDAPVGARAPALRWLAGGLLLGSLFDSAEHAAMRVVHLVDAVKSYTNRDRAQVRAPIDIPAALDDVLALYDTRIRDGGITVERAYAPGLPLVQGFAGDLNQVWSNVVENALDAVSSLPLGAGRMTIRGFPEDDCIVVEIGDNGPGIPAAVQPHIFEPFFTTKEMGEGVGLGLDIARRIVTDLHGGRLSFTSEPADTRFSVKLPVTTISTFG